MSKVIEQSYFYKTSIDFLPDLKNISSLYKPIIGNDAYLLYLEMFNDIKIPCFNVENKKNLFDLFKKLKFDNKTFHKNRKILESVNLLSTYLDNSDECDTKYYFILKHPLEYSNFIANSKLKKLLSLNLEHDKFEELEFVFKTQKIPLSAKEISADINEVFKNDVSNDLDFNFDEIYSRISKITSKSITFSENSKNIINSFYKNFSISINEIEKCILPSIISNNDSFIVDDILLNSELSLLTNKNNNINFYEVIKINRDKSMFKTDIRPEDLNKIFLDYKTIKSEQYLTSVQKQQLDINEITSLRVLRRDFHLPDSIINILLDFSLRKTYGKLNIIYIKKVAKTISGLNLDKVEDIYLHLLDSSKMKKDYKKSKIVTNDINDDFNIVDIVL